MCGKESNLSLVDVEGVDLNVCSNCSKYGASKKKAPNTFSGRKPVLRKERVKNEYKIVDNFVSLLKSARNKRGMNQEDFSKLLNEKESLVAKWEAGTLKPRFDVARRIGRTLGMNFLKRIEEGEKVKLAKSKKRDIFTLGDFIKVRKRK